MSVQQHTLDSKDLSDINSVCVRNLLLVSYARTYVSQTTILTVPTRSSERNVYEKIPTSFRTLVIQIVNVSFVRFIEFQFSEDPDS